MESEKINTEEYFKALKIVHFALVIGLLIFGLISVLLRLKGYNSVSEEISSSLSYFVPFLLLIGIVIGNILFKKKLNISINKPSLKEKLIYYRTALLTRYMIIEMISFIAIVAYLLTGDYGLLGMIVVVIIMFIFYRPTINSTIKDLELNKDEIQILNNPESEIY
jgi:branched-subunit amino acid transport protein